MRNIIKSTFKKVAMGVIPAMLLMNMMVFATGGVNTNVDLMQVVGSILGVLTTIAVVVGIILLAVGLIQFAMAQKSEDVEGKSRAINVIIAALILICFKPLFGGIFSMLGITLA